MVVTGQQGLSCSMHIVVDDVQADQKPKISFLDVQCSQVHWMPRKETPAPRYWRVDLHPYLHT